MFCLLACHVCVYVFAAFPSGISSFILACVYQQAFLDVPSNHMYKKTHVHNTHMHTTASLYMYTCMYKRTNHQHEACVNIFCIHWKIHKGFGNRQMRRTSFRCSAQTHSWVMSLMMTGISFAS